MRAEAERLTVTVAGLPLKNPIVAGAGEATMTREGLLGMLDTGAGAVVAKSANGSYAARRQLRAAAYALLDEHWRPLPFDVRNPGSAGAAPRSASLLCRSGLVDEPFDRWLEILVEVDLQARRRDAYVVGSLIVDEAGETARLAASMEAAGLRWIELNVGAPHAAEAAAGAIAAAQDASAAAALIEPVRAAVRVPLTVKVGGEGDALGVAAAALDAGADAVCLAGRLPAFLPDPATRRPVLGTFGAIGGAWALPVSLRWIAKARGRFGPSASLIGTNGARDGLDVARFLLAGAVAVQMTTAVLTDGPTAIAAALEELTDYLGEQDVAASDIVGEAADHALTYAEVAG